MILPLYSPGPEVADALDLLEATLSDTDELLVVDDGTPAPESAELAELVRARIPSARLVVLEENRGAAAARNHAMSLATGRYVWFVDWDDDWDPALLDVLVTRAKETGAPIVTCRASVVDEHGRLVRHIGPAHDTHLTGPQTAHAVLDGRLEGHLWNKLFRRDVLPDNVFPLMATLSDLMGTAPVLAAAERVEHLGQVLYEHRIRPGSLTAARDRDLALLLDAGSQVPAAVTPFLENEKDASRLSVLFRHRSAYLAAVTALRLPHDDRERGRWLARSRQLLSLSEAASLILTSPTTAARSLALLGLGPAFSPFYRTATRIRRRSTQRVPWQARGRHRASG
ncbi:glycosyltransferase [Ornithinimicrobium sp. F0845]|uniref:glycosyltransferase n=1 Tax=Ornithinimicrobium sp. F0845 TaxID=2926412 RepID=UPI001FF32777|nr:glycosyltransferase [Ornithinimicrobium sp. F0845]